MKIVYLKLTNFIGVKAATGLNEIELKYDRIKQPIVQIYGKNRCGKTVMLQQHHPFSSINLTGDERSDLSLILPGEIGCKNIVYEVNGEVYNITHTYRPTGKSHTIASSIVHNGEELNPSGGVTTFNTLVEKLMGINKYVFQFIINGTNLTSFAGMGATQRKTLLNKAMGIDIYDKIHKLATDDYRFTNKLITSLNHTKEYLLSTYGSYETLFATLDAKRSEREKLDYESQSMKSKMDALSGMIQTIRQQNPESELITVNQHLVSYKNVVEEMGGVFDPKMYDKLVDSQIQLNQQISELKAERSMLMKEIDSLYEKQHDLESIIQSSRKAKEDCASMEQFIASLKEKIESIQIHVEVSMSSQYLFSMLSLAQAVNSTCQEISSSLNQDHLKILSDMIQQNIDVAAVLMREGASLMDSEKEKSVISYIHSLLHSVEGDIPTECRDVNCLYRNSYDTLQNYFKAFQSTSKGKFTRYDLEQFDHAYKNIQTIKRLIHMDIPDEIRGLFDVKQIIQNVADGKHGIDVDYLKHLIEEATKQEQRTQYIKQLHDSEQSLEVMRSNIIITEDQDAVDAVQELIRQKSARQSEVESELQQLSNQLSNNDRKRMAISSIQHIDVVSIEKRKSQLEQSIAQLRSAENEYQTLSMQYQTILSQSRGLLTELDTLEKAFDQYAKTTAEIEHHLSDDVQYKAIAEATSSTKGMPVIAIRETVDRAISTANTLLQVMYDNEIELLRPMIDESSFSLPFRCGGNKSADIRYGSQSESTLLSLGLSLSLASSLTQYNIPLIDEIDAYLDASIRDDFILMLASMMTALGIEQMFLISHNLQQGGFEHIVHAIDISEIISKQKGGD